MKRKHFIFITIFFMLMLIPYWIVAQEGGKIPVAISPGSDTQSVIVWQSCPTFSWSLVKHAASYRIAIFELVDAKSTTYENLAATTSPVLIKDIPGPALSWTLSSEESLKPGSNYIWYVQALDEAGNKLGYWSDGKSFKVEQEIRFIGIEEKLGEILKSYGVNEDTIANVLNDVKSQVKEVAAKNTGTTISPDVNIVNGYEGNANTFYGQDAGASITTGTNNAFIGRSSGYLNSAGCFNTFVGHGSGWSNSTANANTFIGNNTGFYNTTGGWNTFLGYFAGNTNTLGSNNSFLGSEAGATNTTGCSNTFLGNNAGYNNTTANNNIFIGDNTGYSNTTGTENIFIGNNSGFNNSVGNWNTFIGNGAGNSNTEGVTNVYLGWNSGYSNITGNQNLFLGYKSGYNETGSNKLYIANSDSSDPLIYGEFDNSIVTINGKLGIGTKTPAYPVEVDTTGSNSCILVKRIDGAANYINATDAYANFGSTTNHPLRLVVNSSWKMRLNTDGSLSMSNGASCTTGGVWTNASSRSLKENIENLNTEEALDALIKLNPVKYNYKLDSSDKHVGFIAEDVPDLVATSDRKGLSPLDIVAVLTKVIQEQQKAIQEQQIYLKEQQKAITELKERITILTNK